MPQAAASARAPVRFGIFELDLRAGELRRRGLKLKLEGQPLRLLAMLLERPGLVVTREELQRSLWPDGTFVDFEQGINAAVKRLRQVLDDSADTPRYIETLPRRGYRFICPVATEAAATPRPARNWWSARLYVPGAAVVIFVVAIVVAETPLRQRLVGRGLPPVRSVVIFPLENLTGDPGNDYLARGFADDLNYEFLRVKAWDVATLESAIKQQQSGKTPVEAAHALGSDAYVAGTLQQDGSRFRVNLKLVFAANDRQVGWTFRPTREELASLPGIAAIQILEEGSGQASAALQGRLEHRRRANPQAYAAYSMGRNEYWSKITEEGYFKSIDYYREAIAADPNYAEAYSAMARSMMFLHQLHPSAGFKEQARAAAVKALELDSELAEPHALIANMKRQDGDMRGAEEENRLALRLDPNDALAHSNYSTFLADAGRRDEALREAQRAEQLDPRSAFIAATVVLRLQALGRYEEAATQGRKAMQLDPDLWQAHSFTAGALWESGRRGEAIAEWEKARSLPGVYRRWILAQLVVAYAEVGRRADARRAFASLRQQPDVEPESLAAGYAAIGNKKEAIRILQTVKGRLNLRTGRMAERLNDLLGNEPAYQALLRRQDVRNTSGAPSHVSRKP